MKLGLFMMPMHRPGLPHADAYDVDLQTLVRADELGYDEAWIGEHFTSAWENIPAPDLIIAAALQHTRRIRLGTGVANLPNHNPVVLAHRIAQLDQMARGRFNFGIGSGGFPGDFELFRLDPASGEHREITRTSIDLILQVWDAAAKRDGDGLESNTQRWQFKLPQATEWGLAVHMAPFQRPHPPIAVAGLSAYSETLVLAGERGWIPMSINFVPAPTLRTHWEAVEAGARKTGRTPDRADWRVSRDIYVAETTDQARREAKAGAQARVFEEYFLPLVRAVKMMHLFKYDPAFPDDAVTIDWLLDNIWIVGSPDEVAGKLRALHAEVGGFGGVLQLLYDWGDEQAKNERSMELLATKVLPQLTDLTA
jgi:alkanesulfonate monooxygenase SsuD/methylene tetrahydromethanopterin reductase-like flavin-dependent oxidoreductase (luciferase family)